MLTTEQLTGGYLVVILSAIGFYNAGFSGPVPITHTDVVAWSTLSNMKLSAWEVEVLLDLSRVFVDSYLKYSGSADSSPYEPMIVASKQTVSDKVASILRARSSFSGRGQNVK